MRRKPRQPLYNTGFRHERAIISEITGLYLKKCKYQVILTRMKRDMSFSDQLRAIIDNSGMSRYAICKATGTDQGTMSKFMAHKCGLSCASMDRIGALLGIRLVAEVTKPAAAPAKKGR